MRQQRRALARVVLQEEKRTDYRKLVAAVLVVLSERLEKSVPFLCPAVAFLLSDEEKDLSGLCS